jgi:hypothetical protein
MLRRDGALVLQCWELIAPQFYYHLYADVMDSNAAARAIRECWCRAC